jgi:hypothetical protein
MRVPCPPARTTAAGFGGLMRVGVLGRQDSNLGSRDQNPLPYHLATPQRSTGSQDPSLAPGEEKDQRYNGEGGDHDDRDRAHDDEKHGHERDERL